MMPAIVSGLGSLTETRMSTIGQFPPLSLVTAPEVFAGNNLVPVSHPFLKWRINS